MFVILKEWGLTSDIVERKDGNRSLHDLYGEELNLYHEKKLRRVCVNTWKVLRILDRIKLNTPYN